jgi:hypothetical protein
MKIGNLVRTFGPPQEDPADPVPPSHLCVIKEFKGGCIVVEDPRGRILTFNMVDVEVIDH